MKRCPNCHQTFEEEWLAFCTQDGTTLIEEPAPLSDPPPTIMAPAAADAAWNVPPAEISPSSPEWRPPQRVAPAWQPPPPPAYVQPPSKSLAMASMVLGILGVTVGWLCFGPAMAIGAIILGAVALSQIKKDPDRVGGKPMAWTGIATGGATILIYVVFLIIYIIAIIASA